MRPHAIVGALLVASCSAFGSDSTPDGESPDTGTSVDASTDATETTDATDATRSDGEAPETSTGDTFCETQTNAEFCEDFDEGPALGAWKVTNQPQSFSLDTTAWASAPRSGHLVLQPATDEQAFTAYRELGTGSVIKIELDVWKRDEGEQLFELYWPSVGYARFETSGNIVLQRTGGTGPAIVTLAGNAPAFRSAFVHVRAIIDLGEARATYVVDGTPCYEGPIPATFMFSGDVRLQLVGYLPPGNPVTGNIDLAWDNIVVTTEP